MSVAFMVDAQIEVVLTPDSIALLAGMEENLNFHGSIGDVLVSNEIVAIHTALTNAILWNKCSTVEEEVVGAVATFELAMFTDSVYPAAALTIELFKTFAYATKLTEEKAKKYAEEINDAIIALITKTLEKTDANYIYAATELASSACNDLLGIEIVLAEIDQKNGNVWKKFALEARNIAISGTLQVVAEFN